MKPRLVKPYYIVCLKLLLRVVATYQLYLALKQYQIHADPSVLYHLGCALLIALLSTNEFLKLPPLWNRPISEYRLPLPIWFAALCAICWSLYIASAIWYFFD